MLWLVIVCICAGISGGFATVLVSATVESFGGIVGGIIGSIPTTIVASLVGIYFTSTLPELLVIIRIVPLGMLLTLIPLIMWRFLPARLPYYFSSNQRVSLMVTISLILWLILAFITSHFLTVPILMSRFFLIISYTSLGFYVLIVSLFAFLPKLSSGRIGEQPIHLLHHIIRFILGLLTTVVGILFSSWNGEIGGLALAFPAVGLTSLCSIWVTQGEAVSTSAVSPLLLGSTTNSLFAILFELFLPLIQNEIGSNAGFFISLVAVWFLCVYGFSLPVAFLLRKKEMVSQENLGKIYFAEEDTQLVDTEINRKNS